MTEAEAVKDAKKHYSMPEWVRGQKDAMAGIKHKGGTDSYNAGYSFGIWSQEHKGAK